MAPSTTNTDSYADDSVAAWLFALGFVPILICVLLCAVGIFVLRIRAREFRLLQTTVSANDRSVT